MPEVVFFLFMKIFNFKGAVKEFSQNEAETLERAGDFKNGRDLAEILHTYSLSEYP